jgi:hypothetical protein
MARDKRKPFAQPTIDDGLEDLTAVDAGEDFIAGPTGRNDIGNTKRAAAKATGIMGASKKIDPDLKIPAVNANGMKKSAGAPKAVKGLDKGSVKTGSANAHTLMRHTKTNAEIADSVTTTAKRSPAPRSAQTDAATGFNDLDRRATRTGSLRQRVPAPGSQTSVTKRAAVAGDATVMKRQGKPTSSTGGQKPPKRSVRAGSTSAPPLARGR